MSHYVRLRDRTPDDACPGPAPTQGTRFLVLPAAGVEQLAGGEYAESFDVALAAAKRLSVQYCEPFVILELRFRATVGFASGSPARALTSDQRGRRVGRAALAGRAPDESSADKGARIAAIFNADPEHAARVAESRQQLASGEYLEASADDLRERRYPLPPHRVTPLAETCNDPKNCPEHAGVTKDAQNDENGDSFTNADSIEGELVDETFDRR